MGGLWLVPEPFFLMCHRGSLPKRTRSMTTLFQRFFRPMCLPSPYLVPELFSYHCALLTCSRVLSYQWFSVPTSLVPEFCLTNVPPCLVPEVFSYHFALLPCSRVLSYQWSTVPPYLVPEFVDILLLGLESTDILDIVEAWRVTPILKFWKNLVFYKCCYQDAPLKK